MVYILFELSCPRRDSNLGPPTAANLLQNYEFDPMQLHEFNLSLSLGSLCFFDQSAIYFSAITITLI